MSEGKKCRTCGMLNRVDAGRCKRCNSDVEFEPIIQADADLVSTETVTTKNVDYGGYGVARGISKLVSFVGWILVVGGIVTLVGGLASLEKGGFLAILPGIGTAGLGLFVVMGGELTRASIDNAEYNREMLAIMKTKNNG